MGWAELRRAIADDKSNTANWSDESTSVEVTQQKGFMCNVKAKGKLHMEPDKVFDILVAPDNHRYFSGIKVRKWVQSAGAPVIHHLTTCFLLQRIDYRKVLEDDKAGKMKVEVQQVCIPIIFLITSRGLPEPYACIHKLQRLQRELRNACITLFRPGHYTNDSANVTLHRWGNGNS